MGCDHCRCGAGDLGHRGNAGATQLVGSLGDTGDGFNRGKLRIAIVSVPAYAACLTVALRVIVLVSAPSG